jgi:hypothetical protein
LAASGASTVSRALDLVAERRAAKRRSYKSAQGARAEAKVSGYSPLRVAAIALFVLAIGFLAYGFGQQLGAEPQAPIAHEARPPAPPAAHASVSPTSLAAEARNNVLAPNASVESEHEPEAVPPVAVVLPKPPKTVKSATRVPAKVEAPAITPVVVVPPLVVAAAPTPAPTPVAAPDRWQMLSAALVRCNGNLFSKIACEHSARAQYCDGYWGQAAQCPAGVANDHGQ